MPLSQWAQFRYEFEELSSTNDWLLSKIESGLPEGTHVVAHFQTAGRGQRNTQWFALPHENLLVSILLYPVFLESTRFFLLNQITTLATVDTLKQLKLDAAIAIKWPNDILVNNKKVAGILIENHWQGQKLIAAVIGMGLNVLQTQFNSPWAARATSLKKITGIDFKTETILDIWLCKLAERYQQLKDAQIERINRDYQQSLWGKDSLLACTDAEGNHFQGTVIGIAADGQLIMKVGDSVRNFSFKEIVINY
jgi:BirA family biotin operon repressor/biotin-[acetyl-CoA-carboxylase] ligase